jgi:hypothetical protein
MVTGVLSRFYELGERYDFTNEPGYLSTHEEREQYTRYCCKASKEQLLKEMKDIKSQFISMVNRFRNDPKEAAINSVAWATEMVLSFGLWDVGLVKTRNFINPLVNGLKLEVGYRTGKINVAKESTNLIVHALETIPHEANQTKVLKDAIDVVKKNARLLESGNPLSKEVKQITKLPYELIDDVKLIKKYTQHSYDLRVGKKNFTLSQAASVEECQIIGESWVGKNYSPTSDGSGLKTIVKTPDYIKIKVYRHPTKKLKGVHEGKWISNFEEYLQPYEGAPIRKIKNGHLIIKG